MYNLTDLEYRDLLQYVFRYANFKLRNRENAEDATQEALLRVLRKAEELNVPKEKLRAFAVGVARNVIYEIYRTESKTVTMPETEETETEYEVADDVELETVAIDAVLREAVQEKLNQLDELTREIIVLRVWEDLRFHEIADVLSLSENTVKTKFYRGVEELKKLLRDSDDVRLRSISAPFLLAGIWAIATQTDFLVSESFISKTIAFLNSQNLFITNLAMNPETSIAGASSTANAVTAKTILSTTAGKVAVGAIALALLTTIGIGVVALTRPQSPSTGNVPADTTSSSTSTAPVETTSSSTSTAIPDQIVTYKIDPIMKVDGWPKSYDYTLTIPGNATSKLTASGGSAKNGILVEGPGYAIELSAMHESMPGVFSAKDVIKAVEQSTGGEVLYRLVQAKAPAAGSAVPNMPSHAYYSFVSDEVGSQCFDKTIGAGQVCLADFIGTKKGIVDAKCFTNTEAGLLACDKIAGALALVIVY